MSASQSPDQSAPLGWNIAINLIGRFHSAVMALAFIPFYLRVLGPESYGVIGFAATLQSAFGVIDLGLTTTLNRELSRRVALQQTADVRIVVRTLELVYWGFATLCAVLLLAISHVLATHWLRPGTLGTATLTRAIGLIAVMLAFQWPFGFYCGGLLGLERHARYNALLIANSTARYAGGALSLWLVSPTISGLLVWQLAVSAVSAFAARQLVWQGLPANHDSQLLSTATLAGVWRFTASMAAISGTIFVLSQLDRVVLSRLLSLEMFGYYSVATALSASLYNIVTPVGTAVFPRLARGVAAERVQAVAELYHSATQVLVSLIAPVALVIALFATPILATWTHNLDVALRAGPALSILVLATALNGVLNLPYLLQVAYGSTRLTLVTNVVAIVVYCAALLLLVPRLGLIAAPSCWLGINLGYLCVYVPLVHRQHLRTELRAWYVRDLIVPAGAAALVVGALSRAIPVSAGFVHLLLVLGSSLLLGWVAVAAVTPSLRQAVAASAAALRNGHAS